LTSIKFNLNDLYSPLYRWKSVFLRVENVSIDEEFSASSWLSDGIAKLGSGTRSPSRPAP
jgi:hypothetical protein